MAQKTSIQWTDASSNLLRYRDASGKDVWACVKCSPGCQHCYSEKIALRFHRGKAFTVQNMREVTPYFSDGEAGKILRSRKLAAKRVFVDDMTDLFGEWVPFDVIDKHFAVFALRPDVTFQVLTKRPERAAKYLQDVTMPNRVDNAKCDFMSRMPDAGRSVDAYVGEEESGYFEHGYLSNVWLGTSVENQKAADERIPHLLKCPATVRFLSCEPLLGQVTFRWASWVDYTRVPGKSIGHVDGLKTIDWVIVGGESGPAARPFNVQWARNIIAQCKAAGVACFLKQLGAHVIDHGTTSADNFGPDECWPDGTKTNYHRVLLKDKKGGDPSEWPADLCVREFPAPAVTA